MKVRDPSRADGLFTVPFLIAYLSSLLVGISLFCPDSVDFVCFDLVQRLIDLLLRLLDVGVDLPQPLST